MSKRNPEFRWDGNPNAIVVGERVLFCTSVTAGCEDAKAPIWNAQIASGDNGIILNLFIDLSEPEFKQCFVTVEVDQYQCIVDMIDETVRPACGPTCRCCERSNNLLAHPHLLDSIQECWSLDGAAPADVFLLAEMLRTFTVLPKVRCPVAAALRALGVEC